MTFYMYIIYIEKVQCSEYSCNILQTITKAKNRHTTDIPTVGQGYIEWASNHEKEYTYVYI